MKQLLLISFVALFEYTTFAQADKSTDSLAADKTIVKIESEAIFPGGLMGWKKYVEKNLDRNVPARHKAPVGKYAVIVQFTVDKLGNISDLKSVTNFGYGMEEEVMRIIKSGPSWIPSTPNGTPEKTYNKQTVIFFVIDEGFDITMNELYVLYAGIDNPINFEFKKLKEKNLELNISQGSIIPKGNGNYSIRVNKPGFALLEITNKKKLGKKVGAVYFIVRPKNEAPTTTQ